MSDDIGSFMQFISAADQTAPKIYSKKILSNRIKAKLLSYQIPHVLSLINILLQHSVALDGSDTGIGKTYSGAATCSELDRRPIVLCPKTLIFLWRSILKLMGVVAYDVVNYETLRNGKTYVNNNCKSRKLSPYLEVLDRDPNDLHRMPYRWTVPADAIIIIDEGHRCKSPATDNGKLLMSTRQLIDKKIPVLILSATIYEKFNDMRIPFYLFGLIPHIRNYKHYVGTLRNKYPKYKVKRSDHKKTADLRAAREVAQTMVIYEEIKTYTSRIRIRDLGDKFPLNQICAQQFIAEEADQISEAYNEIATLMRELRKYEPTNQLARIQKLKQEIEIRKVPIFIEQAQLYLDEGKSVIIFVNYLDTLAVLSENLTIRCKIHGSQTIQERQDAIDLFQADEERIIILQIRAGGTGISLHDLHGNHPRVTLLNYPDTGSDLLQALGRAYRAGGKTPVLQRIIFVANVEYERRIMQNINRKLTNISLVNDGDLNGHKYSVKTITRKKNIRQEDLDGAS